MRLVLPPEGMNIDHAAACVIGALNGRDRAALANITGDRTTDVDRDALSTLVESLEENDHHEETVPFWRRHGINLRTALVEGNDIDEATASYLIGAALHATLLLNQDEEPDAVDVLRLAQLATTWRSGYQSATADE